MLFRCRRYIAFMAVLLIPILLSGCETKETPKSDPKPVEGPLAKARKTIADGEAVILDVRSRQEWDAGHLEGAIFLPITEIQARAGKEGFFEWISSKIPKEKVVYAH